MTLGLIDKLIGTLHSRSITYCHWKSNTAMAKTLDGSNDLDILVRKADEDQFVKVLKTLGFIQASAPNEAWFPAITHFFGLDHDSGVLVHVHLHNELILGHDLLKNYHLPLEESFLSKSTEAELAVPAVELELIVLVIRIVLKRRLVSLLEGNPLHWLKVFVGGQRPVSESERRELEDLAARCDESAVNERLKADFPFISPELFDQCRASLAPDADHFSWLSAGRKLTRALKPFARCLGFKAGWRAFRHSLKLKSTTLLSSLGLIRRPRKQPKSGGRIIAFVGGDGAGKSTNIEMAKTWLGKQFDTEVIHFGKPPLAPYHRLLLTVARVFNVLLARRLKKLVYGIQYWSIAKARLRVFRRAQQLRRAGTIVLLDRIHLPGLTMMDVPRVRNMTGGDGLLGWLAATEERCHEQVSGVDDLIVMRLDPEIALQRRPNDDPATLLKRSGEIWERKWNAPYALEVDAGQDLAAVKQQVRARIWHTLCQDVRVVEVIGLAGSGKSTLTKLVADKLPNVKTEIAPDMPAGEIIRTTTRLLPLLLTCWVKGLPRRYFQSMVWLQAETRILSNALGKPSREASIYLLDQGPIWRIASLKLAAKDLSLPASFFRWLDGIKESCTGIVQQVVRLNARDEVLYQRVSDRTKDHQLKHMDENARKEFFRAYRELLSETIPKDVPIAEIDTEELDLDACAADLLALLNGGP